MKPHPSFDILEPLLTSQITLAEPSSRLQRRTWKGRERDGFSRNYHFLARKFIGSLSPVHTVENSFEVPVYPFSCMNDIFLSYCENHNSKELTVPGTKGRKFKNSFPSI